MNNFFLILDFIKLNVEINYTNTLLIFFIYSLFHYSLSLPGSIILYAASGYFFGLYIGFLTSIMSLTLGSLFFFIFSAYLLKKIFPNKYNSYLKNINNYFKNSSFEYLIILRIIPGPPLIMQNLFLSILNIKKRLFFLTTILGYIPIVFVSVYFGNQLNNFDSLKSISFIDIFSLEFIIFISFILLLIFLRVIYKKKKN